MSFLCLLLAALASPAAADPPSKQDPVLVTADYRETFDRFDHACHNGRGYADCDNTSGQLAWLEAYLLTAYMEMYEATEDVRYLRQLTSHFDRVLETRDDRLGRKDWYTTRPLAGWGSASYSRDGADWHVFAVHTGNILLGPAEFVRAVRGRPALQPEFGTTAALYLLRIQECIRDVNAGWKNGPAPGEGYYSDPGFGLVPLNMSNAVGRILLLLHEITGQEEHAEKARRLAVFFRNRLRTTHQGAAYDWAYWPKERGQTTSSEDISHAAINVDFAVRCAERGVVFTREDMERFAATWLRSVRRNDGSWAATVGGTGDGTKYQPQAGGRWLRLCPILPDEVRRELYQDIARSFHGRNIDKPSQVLGIAALLRYRRLVSPPP